MRAFTAKHQETRKLLLLWSILADYRCMITTVAGRLQLLVGRFAKFTLHKCQSKLHPKLKVNFFIEKERSWCSGSSGQDSNNLSSEISCAKNHRWYLEANRGVPFQETCSSYFNDCVWPLHLCQTLVHSSCFRQESVWRILLASAYLLFYSQSNAILFMQCMTLLCFSCYCGIKIFSLHHTHKFLLKVR